MAWLTCTSVYSIPSGSFSTLWTTHELQNENGTENDTQRGFLLNVWSVYLLLYMMGELSMLYRCHSMGGGELVATCTIVLCSLYCPCVIGNY